MKRPLTPYESKYGVVEVAENFEAFRNTFSDTIDYVSECHFTYPSRRTEFAREYDNFHHRRIYLADTFFSDTVGKGDLIRLFSAAIQNGVTVHILLLEPMCLQAVERAMELEQAAIDEDKSLSPVSEQERIVSNLSRSLKGLNHIYTALYSAIHANRDRWFGNNDVAKRNQAMPPRLYENEERRIDIKFYWERIAKAQEWIDEVNVLSVNGGELKRVVEMRFIKEQKDMPLYILGHFAYRGVLTPGKSAALSPWLLLIDDPFEPFDIYSTYCRCFEAAWNNSQTTHFKEYVRLNTSLKRKIIIAFSGVNRKALLQVKSVFATVTEDYQLVHYEDGTSDAFSIVNELWGMLSECHAGIVLALNDEKRSDGKWQSRPNVIHEWGLFQAKFGRDRVLVIREASVEGYVGPSNASDDNFQTIQKDDVAGLVEDGLFRALKKFISRIELPSSH